MAEAIEGRPGEQPAPVNPMDGGAPPSSPPPPDPTPPAPPATPPAPTPPTGGPTPTPEPAAPPVTGPGPPPLPPEPPKKTLATTPPDPNAPPPAVPADWPADWREKMASTIGGPDTKTILERLKRFDSPADVVKSWRALESRLSSGDLKKALPNNYTPEELQEYRKSHGIPDTPDGYSTDIGGGWVWGDNDKDTLKSFTTFAHENNMPPNIVQDALRWFAQEQQQSVDRLANQDVTDTQRGEADLRAKWGAEFQKRYTAAQNYLAGSGLWNEIIEARGRDGKLIGNRTDFMEMIAQMGLAANPWGALVLPDNADPAKSVDDRVAELDKMMRDKGSEYWRGPKSPAIQQEYRDLIDAQIKMGKRPVAA